MNSGYKKGRKKIMQLKDIKNGEFFKVVRKGGKVSAAVYGKVKYDRSERKYLCFDFYDAGSEGKYFKGTQEVTTSFEF